MDRRSQQCTEQIMVEMGQDSSRQYLFQNTLPLSLQSHQKSILSNSNTSSHLINPWRGGFLFLRKTADLKNKESWGGGSSTSTSTTPPISSHLRGISCRRRPWEASFSEEFGHQPHFVTAPHAATKWQQEHPQIPVRHNSTQRRRINPNGLLKSLASDSCSEKMTPQPTAPYDSPN